MDLRQIEYVIGVVDHGGFTRAAEALHVTQPSLSYGVRALENELGVKLFHRLSRGVVLSSAGDAFVETGRQVLRDLDTMRASIDAVKGGQGGRLDLVCLPTLAVDPLVTLLGQFRQTRPQVSIRLEEPESAADVVHLVHSGHCELGLTEITQQLEGLVIDLLGDQEMLAVRPPGTPSPRRKRLAVADLAGIPLVATPPGTSSRELIDRAFQAAGIAPVIAVETNQREAIVPLVVAGVGTTFLPSPMADRVRDLGVVIVAMDPPLTRTIGVVRRPGPLSPAADAFLALALNFDRAADPIP